MARPGDRSGGRVDLFFRMVIAASKSRVLRRPFEPATGIPCAMVLTVSCVLSLGTGLCCPIISEIISRSLDTSVGVSGPHAFSVRISAVRPHEQLVRVAEASIAS
jgi:hypothetical protein